MKKVIKVSINKMPFTLAEDAYGVLKVYLDHLRRYYSGREGGSEIVDGIEERIAELLAERTGMDGRVVSKEDIDNILEAVSYTHLRAHETVLDLVCRLLLEKKKHNEQKTKVKKQQHKQ